MSIERADDLTGMPDYEVFAEILKERTAFTQIAAQYQAEIAQERERAVLAESRHRTILECNAKNLEARQRWHQRAMALEADLAEARAEAAALREAGDDLARWLQRWVDDHPEACYSIGALRSWRALARPEWGAEN